MINALLEMAALLTALSLMAARGVYNADLVSLLNRTIIAFGVLVASVLPGDATIPIPSLIPTATPIATPIVPSPNQMLDFNDWNDTVKSSTGWDVATDIFHITNSANLNPCCGSAAFTEHFTSHFTCDPVDHPWGPSNCPAPVYPGYDDTYWPPNAGNPTYSITSFDSREPVRFTVPAGKNWNTVKLRMMVGPRPEVINVYVRSGGYVTYTVLPWQGANGWGWTDVTITLTIKDTISMLEIPPLGNQAHRWAADDILFTNVTLPPDKSEPSPPPPMPPASPVPTPGAPKPPPTPRPPPPRSPTEAS